MRTGIEKAKSAMERVPKWFEIMGVLYEFAPMKMSQIFVKTKSCCYEHYYIHFFEQRGFVEIERDDKGHVTVTITDKGINAYLKQKEAYEVLHE